MFFGRLQRREAFPFLATSYCSMHRWEKQHNGCRWMSEQLMTRCAPECPDVLAAECPDVPAAECSDVPAEAPPAHSLKCPRGQSFVQPQPLLPSRTLRPWGRQGKGPVVLGSERLHITRGAAPERCPTNCATCARGTAEITTVLSEVLSNASLLREKDYL